MKNDTIRQLHQKADVFLDSNKLPEARNIYLQILDMDKENAEACMMLGSIEGEFGRVNDALHYLREAIRLRPDYADPHHTLAHLLTNQGKAEQARDELSKAVQLDPQFTEAWDMLGGLQGRLGDFEGAEHSCRKALELDSTLLNCQLNLANALMEQGKDEEAITRFRDLTSRQLALAPAWARLGALLARQRQPEDAVQALNTALRLNPQDQKSKEALGYVLTLLKDYQAAIPLLREAVEANAEAESCWFALLQCYSEAQDLDTLLGFCDQISEIFPSSKYPIFIKGMIMELLNKPVEALGCYGEVTELAPDWPTGWARAGLVQQAQGDRRSAQRCLKRSLSLGIDDPSVHLGYAQLKAFAGDHAESARHSRLALEKVPNSPKPYCELSTALMAQGKLDEAMEVIRKGFSVAQDNHELVSMLAYAHVRKGEYVKAGEVIQPFLDAGRREPELIVAFAVISLKLGKAEEALRLVEQALAEQSALSNSQRAKLHFNAGDLYNEFGDPENAIGHYHKGNELYPGSFNQGAFKYLIDEMIRVFSRESLLKLSLFGNPSERPVFIVGMIRSGTSLLEQILAAHPEVFGAGELPDIRNIALEMGLVPQNTGQKARDLETLRPNEVSKAAKRYLDTIAALTDGERLVTDKVPSNFLALGLIQVLFPKAKVIHLMRNPMDACVSCYFNQFASSHDFAYSLHDLGFYYNEYMRLMEHWRKVLSLDFLEVQYEELVKDQDGKTRQIVEFCGLNWDDRTLDFHKTGRTVNTLSYDQVRQPIYTSSIGRWKSYEAYLGPLKDALKQFA